MDETKTHSRLSEKRPAVDKASPISKTIQQIMDRAVKAGASSVHIEPRAGYGIVRQRVDGVMQVSTRLPGANFGAVVAQLKKMAKLNPTRKQAPQAGQFTATLGRRNYEVQVSTLPVMDGERVTLHFADATHQPLLLPEIGYWGLALQSINHALAQPHGLIIVSSSDQTSTVLTLGSMLQALDTPYLKLASVEQNPFYLLPNVNQMMVKKEIGMTFGRRLKQALAQGPNVVMVSDVLDKPTAKLATLAAASRQLILAGVHAPNTASALVGFGHLAQEHVVLASGLVLAISQKLVPMLCPECREAYMPNIEQLAQLARIFGTNNDARMKRVHELEKDAIAEQLGVDASQPQSFQPSTTNQHIVRLWQARAGGCKNCNNTGFGGRTTINEVMPNSVPLQTALQASASMSDLRKAARTGGMVPMAQDALVKALRGMIPLETVLANTGVTKKD